MTHRVLSLHLLGIGDDGDVDGGTARPVTLTATTVRTVTLATVAETVTATPVTLVPATPATLVPVTVTVTATPTGLSGRLPVLTTHNP